MDLPYMPLYVTDFISSYYVRLLTPLQFRGYVMLLCEAWNNSDMPAHLPNDERFLAEAARMTPEEWRENRETLLKKFQISDVGFYYNPKLLEVYNLTIKRKEAGRHGGLARAQNLPGAAHHPATSGTHTILNAEPDGIPNSLPPEPAPARAGKKESKPAYDLADFPTLNTPEFAAAFEEWLAYRARRKPAVKTPALMLKKLSAYPVADAIAAMQESETMGYQGVFPEKLRGRAIAPARPKLVNIGPSEGFTADDLEF